MGSIMSYILKSNDCFLLGSSVNFKRFVVNFRISNNFLSYIARQMGHCMGGNFNIHIWACSASPSVQVGRL